MSRAGTIVESARQAPSSEAAQRAPLVMRCGAFGDIVLLTVLLEQLHRRFGKPVDVISSGPWTPALLEGQPSLGRLFLLRSRRMPFWLSSKQLKLVAWLRRRGPGPTWFCDLGAGRELLARAGIPPGYVCDSRQFPWLPGESFADRYLRLGSLTPDAFAGVLPPAQAGVKRAANIVIAPSARAELDRWLARRNLTGRSYLIIHPGSRHVARRWLRPHSGASKYWPEERWAHVVRAVREACPDEAILLSGTGSELGLNESVRRFAAAPDVHNIANELAVRPLLALLERARSMISIDTGPAHAAAALGCPTVALFGTAPPDLYRPGGATTPAVALTGTVDGQVDILGITPEAVVRAWLELTAAQRSAGAATG